MLQIKIYLLNSLFMLILVIIMNMIVVAFSTLFERKIMGLFHIRKGPNKMLFIGLSQPFNDALKLLSKELYKPLISNLFMYLITPYCMLMMNLLIWVIYPFYSNLIIYKFNMLLFLCIMSMSVYMLMFNGWVSNSNFTMIGAIRSIAQSISYEIIFSVIILILMIYINSFNFLMLLFLNKYCYLIFFFFNSSFFFLVSILAEINRTPFDLSESESELISGFNIEYGSKNFVFIFLAEYSSIMFMMMMFNMLFMFISMNMFFYINMILLFFIITWIRMTFPRMRYDNLMFMCWLYLLPFILLNFIYYVMLKYNLDMYLYNYNN
uniref:NADH-ubiquinone oxidoreductase chain 1 n=1 Tax=Xiphozele sp. QL-2014 TaxID=1491726 RepID=A0A0U1WH52_9HYME|nr:NADH dehydrogenase subunit 1 [Xiphozele sp. QL-2014]